MDSAMLDRCDGWDFVLRCLLLAEPIFVPEPLSSTAWVTRDSRSVGRARPRETESVLKNYLFLCRNRPVPNPLAPSPAWGPFFQSFVQTSEYTRYLGQP